MILLNIVTAVIMTVSAGVSEDVVGAASARFNSLSRTPAIDVIAPVDDGRLAASERGAYLFHETREQLYFCSKEGCVIAAKDVERVIADRIGGIYALRKGGGILHCVASRCELLNPLLSFVDPDKTRLRAGGKFYGGDPKNGFWLCLPDSCRRLSEHYLEQFSFDAAGVWASGAAGTFYCDDVSCSRLSTTRLDFMACVGIPGVSGLIWGGVSDGQTWRCTSKECVAKGGISWYNTYAFGAQGQLYGSSGFPDSTYGCDEAGCRKLDDFYYQWRGPDATGGMLGVRQSDGVEYRCTKAGCEKSQDQSAIPGVIGPVCRDGEASDEPRVKHQPGYNGEVRGSDGAIYAFKAIDEKMPKSTKSAHGDVTLVRLDGADNSALILYTPSCHWTYDYDSDDGASWDFDCRFVP